MADTAENRHLQSDAPIHKISVVIPVYNEEECLPELLRRTAAACDGTGKDYELILVDDGSRDKSMDILLEAAAKPDNHIVAVLLNRNYGQHAAVLAGLAQSDGDLVITLDADLQNPPEEIPSLIAKAEEGFDVVGTVRQNRQDSWFRKTCSRLLNRLIQHTTGKGMGDYGCMLRAYRRHSVEAMLACEEHSTFIPILANMFARNLAEINVKHDERQFGTSKYSFFKLINLMFDLLTCVTTTPLRLLSIAGCAVAFSGFALAATLILLRIFLGTAWAVEGVFMLFAILFIFIGAQFIGLGLLGEYIGRIYVDVRARPKYFIQQVVGKK